MTVRVSDASLSLLVSAGAPIVEIRPTERRSQPCYRRSQCIPSTRSKSENDADSTPKDHVVTIVKESVQRHYQNEQPTSAMFDRKLCQVVVVSQDSPSSVPPEVQAMLQFM